MFGERTDALDESVREKRSYTGAVLKPVLARPEVGGKKKRVEAAE